MSYRKSPSGTPLRIAVQRPMTTREAKPFMRSSGKNVRTRDQVDNINEVTQDVEPGLAVASGEGDELIDEAVSLFEAEDTPLSQSPICRSESPLFEPMADNTSSMDEAMTDAAPEAQSEPDRASSPHTDSLDGLKRARAIKDRICNSLKILGPKTARVRARSVIEDPDNHAIKRMRQDGRMMWDTIATELNKERMLRGERQTWTAAAVYSRFVRNAPRIAAAKGEVGFNPQDYMYLRNPATHPASQLPGAVNNPSGYSFGAGGGRKRVRDDEHAEQDLADNLRHKCAGTLSEQAKILEQADMTEEMMEAVAEVTDRFWSFVASDLEKNIGKLFDPKVLESRYHSI
ncbi:hypothetical protein BU23DRAFT_572294 [Bimuria novae-zelandiae CBS 107.79]|uniref:Uncharacterized protein n=1 Tax=Bimuria novae-zelandiae CBS 107.79 TaxID=1447943 RepID=A0A6A5UV12_9PLEO|nr:hypothetical protein BU23DRAFT_572294 [Bimuria novae-zelandiae CBS 107.79]